ncbi:transposase [Enterococcus faecium]
MLLYCFIGIDLTETDLGDHQSARHITKRGNPQARRILYWTVVLMVNSKMAEMTIKRDEEMVPKSQSSSKNRPSR